MPCGNCRQRSAELVTFVRLSAVAKTVRHTDVQWPWGLKEWNCCRSKSSSGPVIWDDPCGRPAQVLCKYAGQIGCVSSDGASATAASANSQSAADSSHDVTIVCLSESGSILLPPGTVKCMGAVLRLDMAKAFGSELHQSGYHVGFKMTSA